MGKREKWVILKNGFLHDEAVFASLILFLYQVRFCSEDGIRVIVIVLYGTVGMHLIEFEWLNSHEIG